MHFSCRVLSSLVLSLIASFNLQSTALSKGLTIEPVKGKSGSSYNFYQRNDLAIAWEIKRPAKSDSAIKLCIPAAFTTTTGTVVGIYSHNGKVSNANQVSKPIGGAIQITNGDFKIFASGNGSCFTPSFIETLKNRKASLFQQYQIVENGHPASFKDKKSFQMRAIVKFADGREGIVESEKAMTFKQFNADLAGMGVEDALYTDMGAWDEGWYKDPKSGEIVPMGNDRSATRKQTNWVVFKERTQP